MLSAFRNCSVETKNSDSPPGGVPVWRRAFAGITVKSDVSPAKSTTCGLGAPAYICCLFSAQTW